MNFCAMRFVGLMFFATILLAFVVPCPAHASNCSKEQIRVRVRDFTQETPGSGRWTIGFSISDSCPSSDTIEQLNINYTYKVRRPDGSISKQKGHWTTAIYPDKSHETVVNGDQYVLADEVITDAYVDDIVKY